MPDASPPGPPHEHHAPGIELHIDPSLPVEQQHEALARLRVQAEQRVKLGMQLFKAAEAHTSHQQQVVDQLKHDQRQMRDQMMEDVARSLHSYDRWIGKMDEQLTQSMQRLTDRMNQLQSQWADAQQRIDAMMSRSETLLDESRSLLETAESKFVRAGGTRVAPAQRKAEPAGDTAAKRKDADIAKIMNLSSMAEASMSEALGKSPTPPAAGSEGEDPIEALQRLVEEHSRALGIPLTTPRGNEYREQPAPPARPNTLDEDDAASSESVKLEPVIYTRVLKEIRKNAGLAE